MNYISQGRVVLVFLVCVCLCNDYFSAQDQRDYLNSAQAHCTARTTLAFLLCVSMWQKQLSVKFKCP